MVADIHGGIDMETNTGGVSTLDAQEHYRIPEACRRLSLSRTALYGLMDTGRIAYCKFGRARRIPRSALEEFIARATVPAKG